MRFRPVAEIMRSREIRLAAAVGNKREVVRQQKAVNMPARFRSLLDFNGKSRWSFGEGCRSAIPGKSPTPIQADFVVWIHDVLCAKLVAKNFAAFLCDLNYEVLGIIGPIGIACPDSVIATSRDFEVLIDRRRGFIRARCRRVPLALATLRPFGGNTWSIDCPSRDFRFW